MRYGYRASWSSIIVRSSVCIRAKASSRMWQDESDMTVAGCFPTVTLHWRTRPFTLSRHRLHVRLQDCDRLSMSDEEDVFHPDI